MHQSHTIKFIFATSVFFLCLTFALPLLADTGTSSGSSSSGLSPSAGTSSTTNESATKTVQLQNPIGGTTENPSGQTSLPTIIGNIIKTILTIVGALALAMFVYGGFTWLTSGGSADRIKQGKNIIVWAIIGLIVIFASYSLVDFLLTALGVS